MCGICRKLHNACLCLGVIVSTGYGVALQEEDYIRVGEVAVQMMGTTAAVSPGSGLDAAGPAITSDFEGSPVYVIGNLQIKSVAGHEGHPPQA